MTGNPRLATMNDAADVLVVDDDRTVAEVVSTYLRRAGHHVRHAADGYEAVAAAEARLPDLVVLDLMLPGIDGIEVLPADQGTRARPGDHADGPRRGERPDSRPRARVRTTT